MVRTAISSTEVRQARALWCEAAQTYGLRASPLPPLPDGALRIVAEHSCVSRGTERLVLEGRVPDSEAERMRCPNQEGTFPFPVKYGYALVGTVVEGPRERIGERVFALHPHQSVATVAGDMAVAVPAAVPPRRAALAANMETALNVVWDSRAAPGDRIMVIGAGVVGLLIAHILSRIAGTDVAVLDRDIQKRAAVEAIGARFVCDPLSNVDIAVNASGNGAALATAIDAAGLEARIVEASWVGAGTTAVPLGGAFHSRRLSLVSSQVGRLPAHRAARWSTGRRLATALDLLADPRLDVLLTHSIALTDAPERLPALLAADGPLAITIDYTET